MDFEAGSWDVGKEASELDNSLFQSDKKKKRKNSRKRLQNGEEGMPKDVSVNKIRKLSIEEKDKSKGSSSLVGGSNSASQSRKEKRDKKWQEKILKRKQMSDTKDFNAGKNVPEQESKISEKLQTNSLSIKTEGAPPMSRAEKRKLKWEIMQQNKRLRLEQSTENSGHIQGDKSADTENDTVNSKAEKQMNRKERRKLLRKQKLKERKLSQKNAKENETQNDNEKKSNKDSDNKDENNLDSKHQTADKKGKKLKKRKQIEVKKHTIIDENNQVNSSEERDMEDGKENENVNKATDSVKQKAKRKRVCKRNKFKGYVKPDKESPKLELEAGEELKDLTRSENLDQSSPKITTKNTDSSAVNNNESLKSDKIMKKKKSKLRKNSKNANEGDFTAGDVKKAATPKVSDNSILMKNNVKSVEKKEKGKSSLDPNILKKMLSPGAEKKKSVNDSLVAEEKHKNDDVGQDDNDFNRKKKDSDSKGKSLLEKSRERLNAARFRYLNEKLYTTTGQEALTMFRNDDVAFNVYHEGFQSQVEKWPTNPIDVIIEKIQSKPKRLVLADFGCGDAKLAQTVANEVHSFDLVALNDHVTVCDMSKVPLKSSSVDIAVFCLSLMGTNLTSYVKEANRILKNNGTLMIAEVSSRFDSVGSFVLKIEKMGFKIKNQDVTNKMFVMMEFKKTADCENRTVEDIELKPCIYKKR